MLSFVLFSHKMMKGESMYATDDQQPLPPLSEETAAATYSDDLFSDLIPGMRVKSILFKSGTVMQDRDPEHEVTEVGDECLVLRNIEDGSITKIRKSAVDGIKYCVPSEQNAPASPKPRKKEARVAGFLADAPE